MAPASEHKAMELLQFPGEFYEELPAELCMLDCI